MRTRTAVALVALLVAFGAGGAAALWGLPGGGVALTELWVSDTPRDNDFNHHGVGVGGDVVVAPVTALQGADDLTPESCSLVRLDRGDGSVRWQTGMPPDRCFSHALTRPAVTDLDGDGGREVLSGTTEDATVVFDAATGDERFRIPMTAYGYSQPTVADLDGDGDPEIVGSDITGGLFVADADGTVRWRADVDGAVYASPVVDDLDGDGEREVLVASRREVVAYDREGDVEWRRTLSGNDVATATVDGDRLAVVVGNDGVVGLDAATGERVWNRSTTGTPAMGSLADGDGDGTPEAYVGVPGSVVRAFDAADGGQEWETQLATAEGASTPPPVLVDLDGDGSPSLVAGTSGGTVAVLDPATGAERAVYERDAPVLTGVTPANLTAAPGDEVLVRYADGRVVALEGTS